MIPQGFQLAGVYSGVKQVSGTLDLSLVVSDRPALAVGVYTQNLVFAAPVAWDRAHTPSDRIRAVVINSGNANACTGEKGLADAGEMARAAAATCDAQAEQALVMSTGIIGVPLELNKIRAGIAAAASQLANTDAALQAAARGIMTTDTVPKLAARQVSVDGRTISICGMAKGAAMIGPNMATMLGLMLTDAPLEMSVADELLREIADASFNCISVDGHMSTNDTVLLVANGAAGGPGLQGAALGQFRDALQQVCAELAQAIPNDGEGATHVITIDITGCQSPEAARQIARTVANSPLVKTAIAGADPNWGRIVSAAGYAGVPFNPAGIDLRVNGFLLYEHGAPVPFDSEKVSASIRDNRQTQILLTFRDGEAAARFWTTDLTAEYVRLNADYHT